MAQPIPKWSAATITAPGYDYATLSAGASVLGGFRALYIGQAGDILLYTFKSSVNSTGSITSADTVLVSNLQAGSILPLQGIAVGTTASGTTAGSLIAVVS